MDQNYSITNVGIAADQFIYDQLKKNDINEVVHYIWYCIESIRFQKKEKNLVQNIMKTLNTINTYKKINHILVIIVLTKWVGIDRINQMRSYLDNKYHGDVIVSRRKEKKIVNGTYLESFGLDRLL